MLEIVNAFFILYAPIMVTGGAAAFGYYYYFNRKTGLGCDYRNRKRIEVRCKYFQI